MKTEVEKDIESSHKNLDHTKEMIDGYDQENEILQKRKTN